MYDNPYLSYQPIPVAIPQRPQQQSQQAAQTGKNPVTSALALEKLLSQLGVLGSSSAPVGVASIPTASGGAGVLMSNGAVQAAPAATGSSLTALTGAPLLPSIGAIAGGAAVGAKQIEGVKDILEGRSPDTMSNIALAPLTGGLSLIPGVGKALGLDRETTDDERKRRFKQLQDKGVRTHHSVTGEDPTKAGGQFRKDIGEDFIGFDDNGTWVNNKFAKSRDVKDLRAEDIWGHFAFYENFGNDWLEGLNEGERRAIAQGLLDDGRISEGRGQIEIKGDINMDSAREKYLSPKKQKQLVKKSMNLTDEQAEQVQQIFEQPAPVAPQLPGTVPQGVRDLGTINQAPAPQRPQVQAPRLPGRVPQRPQKLSDLFSIGR